MRKVRYQALGPLLSGEGSRAFLGLEISEDNKARPVVLIWAPEATASDPELLNKLARETSRAAKLQHPNIIRVFGLAQVDEGVARVVEFADGESLRKVLDVAGTLPPPFAAFVAAEIAAGLHFAHLTGNADGTPLVHGDLRPETVMVSFSGTCKVAGYGALTVAPKEMGGQRVKGRRVHCAPEQVLGGRETATKETDVYLLGIILYECLTGMVPFGEELDFDQAVVSQPLKMINFDAIPIKLVDVIGRATAKRAQDRFPTALAFRDALEHAVGGFPSQEEFAYFLEQYFPRDDEARAARRQEIDAGIADFVRKQWEQSGGTAAQLEEELARAGVRPLGAPLGASAGTAGRMALGESWTTPSRVAMGSLQPASMVSLPALKPSEPRPEPGASGVRPALGGSGVRPALGGQPPSPSRVALGAQPPSPSRVAVQSIPPRPPPPAPPAPVAPPEVKSRSLTIPLLVLGSLLIAGGGVAWGVLQARQARSGGEFVQAPPEVAPAPSPKQPTVPAPAAQPDQAEPVAPDQIAQATPPPERKVIVPPQPAPVVDTRPVVRLPPKPPPPPPEPPGLDITSSPALDVTIDGQNAGRAPLLVELTPGKHQLTLTDAVKGIRVNRTVTVPEHGKLKQSFSVGRGKVSITAPPGSNVILDGKSVGIAPVADFDVWEGSHRMTVTMGKAKWQQPFSVRNGETMTFKVETTPAGGQ